MPASKKITHYIVPMLATAVDKPFNNSDWIFELKLDGYRAIADLQKKQVLLYSRNGLSLVEKFPTIAKALQQIKTDAVLDGEIVLLNENNKPDFQKLQNYSNNKAYPVVFYVFDILYSEKKDLKNYPLIERKKILKKLIRKLPGIYYNDHVEEKGMDLFKVIIQDDMEGMMAKKKDSSYFPGVRTRDWLKIKFHKSQEAIIAGFTEPRGSRKYFGSILLGQYQGKKLSYIGHAGTGFTEKTLKELMQKMQPLIIGSSPFDKKIKTNSPVTWLKPKLVCEISYSEVTRDGILRHPVYKGLRTEKKSQEVNMKTERALPVKKIIQSSK